MSIAYLLIGGNQGNREDLLEKAISGLNSKAGKVVALSSIYETEAWGFESEQDFLNQVVKIETKFEPYNLLDACFEIESELGRIRNYRGYESRLMDIDILFYDDIILETEKLHLPHPRLQDRNFALIPMNEVAPTLKHPLFKKTINEMLSECEDSCLVKRYFPKEKGL